jgi:hypothetical protein
MIIGFSRHGKGGGQAPVSYLTSVTRPGRETKPPIVLRGSQTDTAALIDVLDFKHRYTSGVLSFAPEDCVTPEVEEAIMDRFEQVAFAGLDSDQYNILWVRHSHAGHHELHFLTPRVELSTGKSLNIRPPGDGSKAVFDDLRSEINALYGFADPEDQDRARDVTVPDYVLKIAAEALRRGDKPEADIRVLIDDVLSQRALGGLIRNRSDVVAQVTDLGLVVVREGKDTITVSEPESGQRWRMRGALYERKFTVSGAVEAAERLRKRTYGVPDQAAANFFAQRIECHIARRSKYNSTRYENAVRNIGNRVRKGQENAIVANCDGPNVDSVAKCNVGLGQYLSERLGSIRVLHSPDTGVTRSSFKDEFEHRTTEKKRRSRNVEQVRGAALCPDRPEVSGVRGKRRKLPDNPGVLNDGARKTFIERIQRFANGATRTIESFRASAQRFAEHVQTYCAGQRASGAASNSLARAGEQLDRWASALCNPLREEQAIATRKVAEEQNQRQELRPKSRIYNGPSM